LSESTGFGIHRDNLKNEIKISFSEMPNPYGFLFLKSPVHNDSGKPTNSTNLSIYRLLKAGKTEVL
jgi:hypothetical protein